MTASTHPAASGPPPLPDRWDEIEAARLGERAWLWGSGDERLLLIVAGPKIYGAPAPGAEIPSTGRLLLTGSSSVASGLTSGRLAMLRRVAALAAGRSDRMRTLPVFAHDHPRLDQITIRCTGHAGGGHWRFEVGHAAIVVQAGAQHVFVRTADDRAHRAIAVARGPEAPTLLVRAGDGWQTEAVLADGPTSARLFVDIAGSDLHGPVALLEALDLGALLPDAHD